MPDTKENFVKEFLLAFMDCPEDYWSNNPRQLKKATARIGRLKHYFGWGTEPLVELVFCLANERIKARIPTIYLSSFGSSGSHLVQHVLGQAYGTIGLGEIYLPPRLEEMLNETNQETRCLLLESYHLIHGKPESVFLNKPIINTAHKARLKTFSSSTSTSVSVFLFRDPVDLVVSRTFRKEEWRQYSGKSVVSDKEYLIENTKKTKKFYQAALNYPYDYFLFFEDVMNCEERTVKKLAYIAGRESERENIKDSLSDSLQRGATNKYSGPRNKPPQELIALAESELRSLSEKIRKMRLGDELE